MLKGYPYLFISPDGGLNWYGWSGQEASFGDANNGFSLSMLNQAGAREFSISSDGGKTWTAKTVVSWPDAQLDFVSAVDGLSLATGYNPQRNAYDYALVRTRDAGQSWEIVKGIVK